MQRITFPKRHQGSIESGSVEVPLGATMVTLLADVSDVVSLTATVRCRVELSVAGLAFQLLGEAELDYSRATVDNVPETGIAVPLPLPNLPRTLRVWIFVPDTLTFGGTLTFDP